MSTFKSAVYAPIKEKAQNNITVNAEVITVHNWDFRLQFIIAFSLFYTVSLLSLSVMGL